MNRFSTDTSRSSCDCVCSLEIANRKLPFAGAPGTRGLLGQKVQISIPYPDGKKTSCFLARILWTCSIGDGLFENGGSFLEMVVEPSEIVEQADA